jgi:protein-disulfide isomerase
MNKLIYVLILLTLIYPVAVRSQIRDCACESQVLPETLALVNGVKITSSDIKKSTGEQVSELQQRVTEARKRELDLIINSKLLALEAKRRGVSPVKLLEQEVVAKVKKPTKTEAQVFYDQNKGRITGEFNDVVDDIIGYLSDQQQQKEAKKFADILRTANEVKVLVAEATPPATASERARVLATIKGESITSGDLEDALLPLIFDVQEQVYKLRQNELELSINDTLLSQQAQKRKITVEALLAAEVKPKPVTDEQVQAFFDQNKERVSGDFTQTKDAIKQYLEQIELRQAERIFVERLRAAAAIEKFLMAPESPMFAISTYDQPLLGNADAPVTIVAFTDYQCPSCAAMHPVLEELVNEYGAKVRLVTRDFPISRHTEAFKAAEAAEAAREQGKYWEYIQILLRNQSALTVDKLKGYATDLALDRTRFDNALDSGKFTESIQRDVEDGIKLGVNGTPTIFINGRRVSARGRDELKATIDAALKAATTRMSASVPKRAERLKPRRSVEKRP